MLMSISFDTKMSDYIRKDKYEDYINTLSDVQKHNFLRYVRVILFRAGLIKDNTYNVIDIINQDYDMQICVLLLMFNYFLC